MSLLDGTLRLACVFLAVSAVGVLAWKLARFQEVGWFVSAVVAVTAGAIGFAAIVWLDERRSRK
jgi:hypothetical protein